MDRRTFVKVIGAGAAVFFVPEIARGRSLYVPCPPDPPGDTRSPDRLMEAFQTRCSGDFTVVKTGKDERGAFVWSFRCDGCGDVSPRAFDHGVFRACAEWRERHGSRRLSYKER